MNDKYNKRSPIMKTIQFEIKPSPATSEILNTLNIVENQFALNDKVEEVIKYANDYQREFINRVLSNCSLDFSDLYEVMQKKSDTGVGLDKALEHKRKEIEKLFKSDKQFSELKNTKLFTKILPSKIQDNEAQTLFEVFKGKGSYFADYISRTQRKYSSENKNGTIANRVLENFKIFTKNAEFISVAIQVAGENFIDKLLNDAGFSESSLFDCKYYANYLSQEGIELYNKLISGTADVKGYNQQINEYNQKNKASIPHLIKLKNQIGFAGIRDEFENLKTLTDAQLKEEFKSFLCLDEKKNIPKLIQEWSITTPHQIYIRTTAIPYASIILYGKYDILPTIIEELFGKKKEKISIQELNTCISYARNTGLIFNDEEWFDTYKAKLDELYSKTISIKKDVEKIVSNISLIKGDEETEDTLKEYLDNYTYFRRAIAIFNGNDIDDMFFYETLYKLQNVCVESNKIYNKTRSYITSKPSASAKKTGMHFGFTEGLSWFEKECDRLTVPMLLSYEKDYYIGIPNKELGGKRVVTTIKCFKDVQDNSYKKMIYKSLEPVKSLPRMIWTKKVKEHFESSSEDYDLNGLTITKKTYELCYLPDENSGNKKYTLAYLRADEKNTDIYSKATHAWISLCMSFIKSAPSFKGYDFSRLKSAESYTSVNEFYTELALYCYAISYEYIPASEIERLTNKGEILLFKLCSRGLTQVKQGKPNVDEQAKYFCDIFYDAEKGELPTTRIYNPTISYRDKAISKPYIHTKGSYLVNKRTSDGETIPNDIYTEILSYVNKKDKPISKEAAVWMDRAVIKKSKYDIIKDRRYTLPHFTLHIPVMLNYAAQSVSSINTDILEDTNLKSANILAITRGQRNLMSMVLMGPTGDILWTKALNEINGFNYKEALTTIDNKNQQSRRQWKTIQRTTNLKDSYLGNAISVITRIAIENKAIIIVEDINNLQSSKGMHWIDNRIYSKFNTALAARLSCFSLKERKDYEPGGVLNPLQLAEPEWKWVMNGIIMKIMPSYTANVDPETGFIPQFQWSKYYTQSKKKEFFSNFKKIDYNKVENVYEFKFDYNDYIDKPVGKKEWCVTSFGNRFIFNVNKKTYESIDLTKEITEILDGHPISSIISGELPDKIYAQLFDVFKLIMQLKNYTETNTFIISPVKGREGKYYNSLNNDEETDIVKTKLLAIKGQMSLFKIIDAHEKSKKVGQLTNDEWVTYLQNNDK